MGVHFAALALIVLSQTGSNPLHSLSKSLDALGAKPERALTRDSQSLYGRPAEVFVTTQSAASVRKSLAMDLLKHVPFIPSFDGSDKGSFYVGDRELTISTQSDKTYLFYTRTPEWVRAVRERRSQLEADLENAFPDFAILSGEGWYNQIMYPAGSSETLYYRGGEMDESETLTAFGRRNGKPIKLWTVKLAPSPSVGLSGTLNQWLLARDMEAVGPSGEPALALGTKRGLAYYNDNHGDGGHDIGFIDESGKNTLSQHPLSEHKVITLLEERYVKAKGIKPF